MDEIDIISLLSNAQCLTNVPVANISDSTQLWNAKDECNLLYGNNSIYCYLPGQIWSVQDQCMSINPNSYYCNVLF
jgi:hypothetical protein